MTRAQDGGDVAHLSVTLPSAEGRCEIMIGPGLLRRLPALLEAHAPAHRYVAIADRTVAELHGQTLLTTLRDAGLAADLLDFPPGETSKTPATWTALHERLAALGAGRDAGIIALGGGVTGDLAGFVAATHARGLTLVQAPTSLLAMIDASLGGKTGIDLDAGKNLVGAFHQPRLVVADPVVLDTLPDDELRTGLAEAVKHGAIDDAGALDRLAGSATAILDRRADALQRVVVDSVRVKVRFVAEDPRETGPRAMLNFGHTVAHALERLSRYSIRHGDAVAMGMVAEARIGEAAGLTDDGTARHLASILERLGLPTALPAGWTGAEIVAAAASDKKARVGAVRYALITRPGEPARTAAGEWTHGVADEVAVGAIG